METTLPMLQVQCQSQSQEEDTSQVKLVKERSPRRGHPEGSPTKKQKRDKIFKYDILLSIHQEGSEEEHLVSAHEEGSDGGFQVSSHLEEDLLESNHQESSEEQCLVSSHKEARRHLCLMIQMKLYKSLQIPTWSLLNLPRRGRRNKRNHLPLQTTQWLQNLQKMKDP